MKKSDMQRVARITLITAFCALLFFIVVMVITKKFDGKYINGEYNTLTPAPSAAPVAPKDLALEMIFVTDEDGSLQGLYLAEMDCVNLKWRLSVIPLDSRLNLSVSLYKQVLKENIATPQLASVAEFYKCFSGGDAIRLTGAAVSELLPVSPDYTLVMPVQLFNNIFKKNPENYSYAYFLRDNLESNILAAGGMQSFMLSILSRCECTLSQKDHLYYLESFENLTNLDVTCRLIPGSRHNNGYEISATAGDFYTK